LRRGEQCPVSTAAFSFNRPFGTVDPEKVSLHLFAGSRGAFADNFTAATKTNCFTNYPRKNNLNPISKNPTVLTSFDLALLQKRGFFFCCTGTLLVCQNEIAACAFGLISLEGLSKNNSVSVV
jgi:hypothetical protein